MPVDKKDVESAPNWFANIRHPNQSAKVAKFLRNNKDKSFTRHEISKQINMSVKSSCISGLHRSEVVKRKGGFIHIRNESRCKELVRICDI